MDFKEVIKERRSIRKYKDEDIDKKVISEIVELARFSPSWKNSQIARFIAVSNKEIKDNISHNCTYGFKFNENTIDNSKMLIVLTYVKGRSGFERDGSYTTSKEDRWESFDCGIYANSFCLAAKYYGLGTCILGIFDEEKVKEALSLEENMGIGALITIGYPDEMPSAPKRKEIEEILKFI